MFRGRCYQHGVTVIFNYPPKAVFLLVHAFFFLYFRVFHYIDLGDWVFISRGPYLLRPLARLVAAGPGTSSSHIRAWGRGARPQAGGRGAFVFGPCSAPLDDALGGAGACLLVSRCLGTLGAALAAGGWVAVYPGGLRLGCLVHAVGVAAPLSRVGLALLLTGWGWPSSGITAGGRRPGAP